MVQAEHPAVHGERVVGSVAQGGVEMPVFGSEQGLCVAGAWRIASALLSLANSTLMAHSV